LVFLGNSDRRASGGAGAARNRAIGARISLNLNPHFADEAVILPALHY
jgi:hypothetical protein